jgi:putative hydrolase of the HAD superfamily
MSDERRPTSETRPPSTSSHEVRQTLPLPKPRCVILDVDRTLMEPGEVFSADGYAAMGERYGLALDPARWLEGQAAALAAYRADHHARQLLHDDDVFARFAEIVVRTMAGPEADAHTVTECTAGVLAAWNSYENFALYTDVEPCLERLHEAGLRVALLSNTNRDLEAIVDHFDLRAFIDAAVSSAQVGHVKPSPRIFAAALDVMHARADETVMVGDSYEEDVRGALAAGLGAILLDRVGSAPHRHDDCPTITSLLELPPALGI